MARRRCQNDVIVAPNNGLNSMISLLVLCSLLNNKDECGFGNNSWLLILLLMGNGRGIC